VARLKLTGKNMAVNDLVGLLPAFGVELPSGASLQGGVANMDLAAEGPLDRLVITGPLSISNTKLTGYNLSQKLGAIAAFTGIKSSNETLIQTASSGVRVAPEGIRADNLYINVPEIGELSGSGVIGNNKSLDFKMLLKLSSKAGGLMGGLGALTSVAQNKGIPFLVQGNTTNPVFRPAMGEQLKDLKSTLLKGDTKSLKEQQQGVKDILGGFLGKKPTPTPKP
jgi:AsmA protein